MVDFLLQDLECMRVSSHYYLGKREVLISDYTTEHLDEIGRAWEEGGADRAYVNIPQDVFELDGHMVPTGEKAGVTGINQDLIRSRKGKKFQIKAPMSLD